jgi:hypothetical protein
MGMNPPRMKPPPRPLPLSPPLPLPLPSSSRRLPISSGDISRTGPNLAAKFLSPGGGPLASGGPIGSGGPRGSMGPLPSGGRGPSRSAKVGPRGGAMSGMKPSSKSWLAMTGPGPSGIPPASRWARIRRATSGGAGTKGPRGLQQHGHELEPHVCKNTADSTSWTTKGAAFPGRDTLRDRRITTHLSSWTALSRLSNRPAL